MNHFPATESTLSAEALGLLLQANYKLSTSTICKLFHTGINHLYMVADGTHKFVFRAYTFNWRSPLEIAEEVRLLNHLKDNDVPVSYPIADQHNNFIQEFAAPEGKRYGVLFSFANGGKVREFTQQTCFNIGAAMANLHRVTENFELQRVHYTTQTLLEDSFVNTKQFFSKASADMAFVERTTQNLLLEYARMNVSNIRSGAIHLDIWFDNLHVDAGDRITFFDFDFCGNGWLCYDIAYFLFQLYNTHPTETLYEQRAADFLRGYESITPISDEEKRILPIISISLWFFYLGVQCNRFDTWSNIFLNEDHLKRFIGMLKKWIVYNKVDGI